MSTDITEDTATAADDPLDDSEPTDVVEDSTVATADPQRADVETVEEDISPSRTKHPRERSFSWSGIMAFGVVPLIVVALAAGASYLKFSVGSDRAADKARTESVQAATDATVAMLSYNPDNVEATLHAAEDRLTGPFRESYRALIDDVVIAGAKQKKIAATATVPAAAVIAATERHATVMVFVNQSIIMGADAPTDTASAVEVTLDKVDQRWLVSGFEPK